MCASPTHALLPTCKRVRPRLPHTARAWMYSFSGPTYPFAVSTSMAVPNAPTPGKSSRLARAMSSGPATSRTV
jgi:hypothetical protein